MHELGEFWNQAYYLCIIGKRNESWMCCLDWEIT